MTTKPSTKKTTAKAKADATKVEDQQAATTQPDAPEQSGDSADSTKQEDKAPPADNPEATQQAAPDSAPADKQTLEEPKASVKEKAPAKPQDKAYDVQWQLRHNGKKYEAGDEVTLTDEDAAPLLEMGVLKHQGDAE